MTRLRTATALGAALAMTLTACTSAAGPDPADADPTSELEVISWWTSGSEHAALQVLYDAFAATHPDVEIIDGTVAGGGGSNVQIALSSRLRADDPPDVWQTFIGTSLAAYAGNDHLSEVSALYEGGYADALVPEVLDAVTIDGEQYGVPTGAHRQNMLWFNEAALAGAGVTPPGADYSLDQWRADLAAVTAAGTPGLCLGAQDRFAVVELFEDVLLSTAGTTAWEAIVADRFDWAGDTAGAALTAFGEIVDAAAPGADGMSWADATAALAAGDCAYLAFNDSAYGELVAGGADPDADFGGVPFPGTDAYLAVVDTFVLSAQAVNARNGYEFLAIATDPVATLAFNAVKGSVPVRTDVDAGSLSAYQQASFADLQSQPVLLSITDGEAMSPAFQEGFYDAVMSYRTDRDQAAFVATLRDAVIGGVPGFG